MDITSGLVLFVVIWVLVFFVVLPQRLTTQDESGGEVTHGTHRSAPAEFQLGRKVKITSLWAVGLFVVIAGVILSGVITIEDIDWFDRMTPPSQR